MMSNICLESFLLGALWSGAVFSIIGQIPRAPKFYIGGGGALFGLIGFQVYTKWNDTTKVQLNYPFQQIFINYPNKETGLGITWYS